MGLLEEVFAEPVLVNDKLSTFLFINFNFDIRCMENSTTLRKFPQRSSWSVFYSTAISFFHLQSGLDFVLRTKQEILCLVAGLTKIYTSNEKVTRGEETSIHSEETMCLAVNWQKK